MPTFLLYIKADLENVSKIEVPDGGRFCIDVSSNATATAVQHVLWLQPASSNTHEWWLCAGQGKRWVGEQRAGLCIFNRPT